MSFDPSAEWPEELNENGPRDFIKEIQKLQDDNAILITCLQSLVDLNDHKDSKGKDDYYLRNIPKAWEYAKNVLKEM